MKLYSSRNHLCVIVPLSIGNMQTPNIYVFLASVSMFKMVLSCAPLTIYNLVGEDKSSSDFILHSETTNIRVECFIACDSREGTLSVQYNKETGLCVCHSGDPLTLNLQPHVGTNIYFSSDTTVTASTQDTTVTASTQETTATASIHDTTVTSSTQETTVTASTQEPTTTTGTPEPTTTTGTPEPTTTTSGLHCSYAVLLGYIYDEQANFCYNVHTDKKTWFNADVQCINEGGFLARLNTDLKLNLILAEVILAGVDHYIGGKSNKAGLWRWIADNSTITNYTKVSPKDCLQISAQSQSLADTTCGNLIKRYVCEISFE